MAAALGYSEDALSSTSKSKMRDYGKEIGRHPEGKREQSGANWGNYHPVPR